MVTALSGGRGQVVIKGKGVTLDWEQLVRGAAERNGQQFADAVVEVMRDWALTILKREPAEGPSPNLPARIDDGAMLEQMAARLERIERASRRGRWRR